MYVGSGEFTPVHSWFLLVPGGLSVHCFILLNTLIATSASCGEISPPLSNCGKGSVPSEEPTFSVKKLVKGDLFPPGDNFTSPKTESV